MMIQTALKSRWLHSHLSTRRCASASASAVRCRQMNFNDQPAVARSMTSRMNAEGGRKLLSAPVGLQKEPVLVRRLSPLPSQANNRLEMLLRTRLTEQLPSSSAFSNNANTLKGRAQIPSLFSSPRRASRRSGRSHRAAKKHEITNCRLSFCCFVLASRHQEAG